MAGLTGLTDKQEKYVRELLKGKSQREAYRLAYPKSKDWKDETVDVKASELLKNDKVSVRYNEIHNRLIKESEDECIVSAKEVLRELSAIAFFDITEIVNTDGEEVYIKPTAALPDMKKKAISSIKQTKDGIEIKFHDKEKALELLGRHLGMFKDKVEVSGDMKINNPYKDLSTEDLKKLIEEE